MKQISECGSACFSCMIITITVSCLVAFTTTFWLVGFGDCSVTDYFYFVQLTRLDTSGNVNDDFITCETWSSIEDSTTGAASDDAGDYASAHGLVVTSFVLALVCCFSVILPRCITTEAINGYLRYTSIVLLVIITIFLITAMGMTTGTYYTTTSNYVGGAYCDQSLSVPYTGYAFMFFGLILSFSLLFAIISPCCGCAKPDEVATNTISSNPMQHGYPQAPQQGYPTQPQSQPQVVYGGQPGQAPAYSTQTQPAVVYATTQPAVATVDPNYKQTM
mgnify:CR=1 FL=1